MPIFCLYGCGLRPFLFLEKNNMRKHTRHLVRAAIIAALYAVLTPLAREIMEGTK